MSRIHVFVSFDPEHDSELYEQLVAQSRTASIDFAVSGGSERSTSADVWSERTRRLIREADQMIVICGGHTDSCTRIASDLRMAQEEGTPYFLLWGRREIMCSKPIGAKSAEGIYSWTPQILQNQIALTSRSVRADAMAEGLRSPPRKSTTGPSDAAP